MVITLSDQWIYALSAALVVLILFVVFRIGISVGRRSERLNWVELADSAPKNFIITPNGDYTVFSRKEWDAYGLMEISEFTPSGEG